MILLDAVNIIARSAGEGRFSDITSSHPTVDLARDLLQEVQRNILANGWWFNRDKTFKLAPNTDGEIVIPDKTLSIKVLDRYNTLQRRGNRLYDTELNTYKINKTVHADIIFDMDFDDIPHLAQVAIAYQAAYDFVSDDDGDDLKAARAEKRAQQSMLSLYTEHLSHIRVNALDAPATRRMLSGMNRASSTLSGDYIGGRL